MTVKYGNVPVKLFAKTGSWLIWSKGHSLLTPNLDLSEMSKSWLHVECTVEFSCSDYLLSLVSMYSWLPLSSSEDNEELGQLMFCEILEVRKGRTEVLGSHNFLDTSFFSVQSIKRCTMGQASHQLFL